MQQHTPVVKLPWQILNSSWHELGCSVIELCVTIPRLYFRLFQVKHHGHTVWIVAQELL